MPECRLVVLGLSEPGLKGHGGVEKGVGKSSLCFRFVHPSQEEYTKYGEDHESAVSLADFEDAELNHDHFLYFGKARRDYLPSRSEDPYSVTFHVVEHTEFVDDGCYRPLGSVKKPYQQRAAAAKLCSPGKVAYYCHSTLGFARAERFEFPTEFSSNGVDGYLFVLDPTRSPRNREEQIQLLDELLEQLPKRKPVAVVLTKCDALSPVLRQRMTGMDFDLVKFFASSNPVGGKTAAKMTSGSPKVRRARLSSVPGKMELKRNKTALPYFCSSSRLGIGVDLAFLYVAHVALRLPGEPPTPVAYDKLTEERSRLASELYSAANSLLSKAIGESATAAWSNQRLKLRCHRDFQRFEEIFGEEKSKALWQNRLDEKHRGQRAPGASLYSNKTLDSFVGSRHGQQPTKNTYDTSRNVATSREAEQEANGERDQESQGGRPTREKSEEVPAGTSVRHYEIELDDSDGASDQVTVDEDYLEPQPGEDDVGIAFDRTRSALRSCRQRTEEGMSVPANDTHSGRGALAVFDRTHDNVEYLGRLPGLLPADTSSLMSEGSGNCKAYEGGACIPQHENNSTLNTCEHEGASDLEDGLPSMPTVNRTGPVYVTAQRGGTDSLGISYDRIEVHCGEVHCHDDTGVIPPAEFSSDGESKGGKSVMAACVHASSSPSRPKDLFVAPEQITGRDMSPRALGGGVYEKNSVVVPQMSNLPLSDQDSPVRTLSQTSPLDLPSPTSLPKLRKPAPLRQCPSMETNSGSPLLLRHITLMQHKTPSPPLPRRTTSLEANTPSPPLHRRVTSATERPSPPPPPPPPPPPQPPRQRLPLPATSLSPYRPRKHTSTASTPSPPLARLF